MKKNHTVKLMAALLAACSILSLSAVPSALAYLTDIAETMDNPFTIALDCTTTVVEKYPAPGSENPNTPVPDGNTIDYEKLVQIANTGFIDCYVRAYVEFSEDDIRDKSSFSSDGVNWYPIAEYANHLPEGWVYNPDDGFYYYKTVLLAENWETVQKKLVYDKNYGEYFYPDEQRDVIADVCISEPLIRYVKTEFSSPSDMRTYNVYVYNESVPFYFGSDYSQAWESYLELME